MRRYGDEITMSAEVEFSLSQIMNEIDDKELVDELLNRDNIYLCDSVKVRKMIVMLIGLPQWYYSDKNRILEEVEKLF